MTSSHPPRENPADPLGNSEGTQASPFFSLSHLANNTTARPLASWSQHSVPQHITRFFHKERQNTTSKQKSKQLKPLFTYGSYFPHPLPVIRLSTDSRKMPAITREEPSNSRGKLSTQKLDTVMFKNPSSHIQPMAHQRLFAGPD